jgi:Ca2+-binding RTX toxin-like protein
MFGKRRLIQVGLALLASGACACGQEKGKGTDFDPAGYDGFSETHFDLLQAACSYDISGNMTLTVGNNESAYLFLRSADNLVVANANKLGVECTASPTAQIIINGGAGVQTVLLDYNFGVFGLGTATSLGVVIDLGAGNDTLEIRGTPAADTITFGTKLGGLSYAAVQVAPGKATAFPAISFTGVENVKVSTGAGNDVITGQGGAAVGNTKTWVVGPLLGSISMTVYGGDGDDTITSGDTSIGLAINSLNGGPDNDLFLQQAAFAADLIAGGTGTDTVDYSVRTRSVNVSLGGAAARGSVTFPLPTAIADNDTLTINDGANAAKVFNFQKTANAYPTGSLTFSAVPSDGDTFTLKDVDGTAVTFFYKLLSSGGADPGTDTVIDCTSGCADAAAVAAKTAPLIAGLKIAGTVDAQNTAKIDLVGKSTYGAGYAITKTGTAISFVGMNGTGSVFTNSHAGSVVIDLSAANVLTANDVAKAAYAVIAAAHGATFTITAIDPGATAIISLINDTLGAGDEHNITASNITAFPTNTTPSTLIGMTATSVYDDGDIAGKEGDDIAADVENVVGGTAGDTINASLSNGVAHVLMGMAGDDTLTGGLLADYLYGGPGKDVLVGGAGADFLKGGDGNDTLRGGLGNDNIDGAGVNCVAAVSLTIAPIVPWVSAACGSTFAKAGTTATNDVLDYSDHTAAVWVDLTNVSGICTGTNVHPMGDIAGTECDILVATSGVANVRSIIGSPYGDTLYGDAQDNVIWGGAGDDTIWGRAGNDYLYGQDGDDTIYGNDATDTGTPADNDFIVGGIGTNHLYGQGGVNTIDASLSTTGDVVNCGSGTSNVLLDSAAHAATATGCTWQ